MAVAWRKPRGAGPEERTGDEPVPVAGAAAKSPVDTAASDAALAAAAQIDAGAFATLWESYYDPVFRYCRYRLPSFEDAEDAANDVFADALAGIGRFREDAGSFRSWLFSSDEDYNNTFPAFADGTIFTGGASGTARALDAATGAEKWRFATGGVVRATPVAKGLVYVPSEDGNLYALDPATGMERWRANMGDGAVVLSPVVTNGAVIVTAQGIAAFDAETGAQLWEVPQTINDTQSVTGATINTPSVAGETVYVYLPDRGGLAGLDLATGEEKGFAAAPPVRTTTAIAGGVLYAASTDGILFAFASQGSADSTQNQATPPSSQQEPAETSMPSPGGPQATYLWSADAGVSLLAFPPDRTIWRIDVVAGTVSVLDRDGIAIDTWGTPGEEPGQFNFKVDDADGWWVDVSFEPDGSYWITECGNERVEHFDASHTLIGGFGTKGERDGQFLCPAGIAFADNGDLFVVDEIRGNIQRFTPDGTFVTSFGSFVGPGPLTLDAQGNLVVPDSNDRRVTVLSQDGTELFSLGELGSDTGQLSSPVEVAVDDAGNFYVADQYATGVMIFDPQGAFLGSFSASETPDGAVVGVYAVGNGGNGSVYISVGLEDGSVRVQKYKVTIPTPALATPAP